MAIHLVVECDRDERCTQRWMADVSFGAEATLLQAARNGWLVRKHAHYCPIHSRDSSPDWWTRRRGDQQRRP